MRNIGKQQLLSFVIVECIGIFAVLHGMTYRIGSLSNMGAGFFPVVIGALMMITGVAILLSSDPETDSDGEDGPLPGVMQVLRQRARPLLLVLVAVLSFIVVGQRFGLVPGTFLLGVIASFADKKNSIKNALAIAVFLTFLCVAVFIWFLNVPFPLFGAL